MVKSKILYAILLGLVSLLASCFVDKKIGEKNQSNKEIDLIVPIAMISDTIKFDCNGKTIVMKNSSFKLLMMSKEYFSCIEEKAFFGDVHSEMLLAKLLKEFGCNYSPITKNSRFRGEIIFNALLEIEPLYRRALDFDGEPVNCTDACICTSNLTDMMESAYRQNPSTFFFLQVYESTSDYYRSNYTDEEIIAFDKKSLRLIKQAWEEGKIVLKPYGEM